MKCTARQNQRNYVCVPTEDSDPRLGQPEHPPGLIRVFSARRYIVFISGLYRLPFEHGSDESDYIVENDVNTLVAAFCLELGNSFVRVFADSIPGSGTYFH